MPVDASSFGLPVQLVLIGLLNGGLYAIAASGLSLIYGVQRILNVAHGDLVILAAYLTWIFSTTVTPQFELDPLVSVAVNMAVLGVIGFAVYLLLIRPVQNLGFEPPLLATFGLAVFLQTIMSTLWTGYPRLAVNQPYSSTSVVIGSIFLPQAAIIGFVAAVFVLVALHFFLGRTFLGRALRASSQDWEAAGFTGVNVGKVRGISFIIGTSLAGLAGAIVSISTSFVPTSGTTLLLIMLTIIALGGIGNVRGTLLGGITIGAIQQLGAFYLGPEAGTVLTFTLFLVVLILKPRGIIRRG